MPLFSQNEQNDKLTNVFPENGLVIQDNSNFNYTLIYSNSGSAWSVPWSETNVYDALLSYTSSSNPNHSYEMRIGKGGQIYSFITSSGETVPPQWRNPNGPYGSDYAPWVDEVWQMVAVDVSQNDRENNNKYFIHQAGVYLTDPDNISEPFYSPQIASFFNSSKQEYTTVNWGQQAHLADNLDVGFTSSLLYYAKYKNIGNGIIQVDYLIYNFGEDQIQHVNVPWGGVRRSVYDHFFVSNPDNSFDQAEGTFGSLRIPTPETNGWVAFSSDSQGDAPAMAILINNDNSTGNGTLNLGDAGSVLLRNYTVYTGIRNRLNLDFGEALRVRNFFILGNSVDNIQSSIADLNLQDETFFDYQIKSESETDEVFYFFERSEHGIDKIETTSENSLHLRLQPYANSYPLFIIKGTNDLNEEDYRITSNLYCYSSLPYNGLTLDIELIGFSHTKKEIVLDEHVIAHGGNYTFPDGTEQSNITSRIIYLSDLGIDANGYNQLVQTTIDTDESLTITSFDTIPKNDKIEIYPNPSLNTFKISKNFVSCSLLNILGQKIKSFPKNQSEYNISDLSNGVYFIEILLNTNEKYMIRFIKK
jgi:hypothetical protein